MKLFVFIGFIAIIELTRSQQSPCPPTGTATLAMHGFCQRFFRCVFGTAIVQECATGLHFDEGLGVCNLQERANCNPCKDNPADSVSFSRDPTNCSRFSICVGTSLTELVCEEGLYFDLSLNECASSQNVDCRVGETTTTFTPTTSTVTTTTTQATTTTMNPNMPECPLRGIHIFAYPGNCGQFVRCFNGNGVIINCPPGLYFDEILGGCYESDANC